MNINWKKISGILILGIWAIGMILNILIQQYRGSSIYWYGNSFSHVLFYGGMLLSLANSIILIIKHRMELRRNLVWIILSSIPFLYMIVIIIKNSV